MASSGNFMTFMPSRASVTLANGNTKATGDGGNFDNPYCNFSFDAEDTDGFYWEWRVGSSDGSTAYGISKAEVNDYTNTPNPTYGFYFDSDAGYAMQGDGNKRNGSTNASYGGSSTSGNKVIGIAVRSGKIYFSIDGTFQNSGDPVNQTGEAFSGITGFWTPTFALNGTHNGILNAGQDSTFSGNESAGGNADANGFGEFHTAPPTGFKALCSANLPISADIDPAQTDDDFPQKQFNAVTWTGNRSSNSTVNNITGVGFQPDLVWLKFREQAYDWRLVDSSRGVTQAMRSNEPTGEQTEANGLYQFDSDGFSVKGDNNYNYNGGAFIGYCWRANGGTTASNSDGATASVTQANTKSGFSIVTYTGFSGASGTSTVGHGLQKAPEFIITKSRNSDSSWWVQHVGLSAVTKTILINSNSAEGDYSGYGSLSAPTSSVFSINGVEGIGGSSRNYIAYCWHNVEGFQKFGSYEGNGNADGITIVTNFRPRLICIKSIDSSQDWIVMDTARETFNPLGEKVLAWNDSYAEFDPSTVNLDVLSNGFKLRGNDTKCNASQTYIYMAWGDIPFKYNNTF
ncbi:hypothetical protein [uncultured Mediterranean phage uvMED]|nr:hypothetical protein [uncultured Mediterranean phage uvMED]BAQ85887.1 hypothetical protein [uncultured Mediterranean phage uvMED]